MDQTSEKKKWQCPHCDKCVLNRRKHLQTHSQVKPFTCDSCNTRFKRNTDLRKHKRVVHSIERPFRCNQCDYAAKCKHGLLYHIRGKHCGKNIECDVTGCRFRSKWLTAINKHKQQVHSDVRPFACDECDYRAKTKGNLEIHVSGVHHKSRPFGCNECGYRAQNNTLLLQHILRIHRKEKPFTCRFCDYRASTRRDVVTHEVTHSDDSPFKCHVPDCGFRSKTEKGLRRHHMSVHLKIKPYECHVCYKRYLNSSEISRHMRTHANEGHDMQSCGECRSLKTNRKQKAVVGSSGQSDVVLEDTPNSSGVKQETANSLNDILPETHSAMQLVADIF